MTRGAVIATALAWAGMALAEEPSGFAGGRVVFVDGEDRYDVASAEEEIGGERISVELRHGELTQEATLRRDGTFLLAGPPGKYRLEYIVVGERAEFIPPQELWIEAGQLTCVGELAIDTGPIENLGTNQTSKVSVTDGCEAALPELQRLAKVSSPARTRLARTGPIVEHLEQDSWLDYAGALRVEAGGPRALTLRLTYFHEIRLRWQPYFAVNLHGSVGQQVGFPLQLGADRLELLGGGGIGLWGVDASLYGGIRQFQQPIGTVVVAGALARMSFGGGIGLGVRGEVLPYPDWTVFVDFSPVAFLGGLL